MRQKISSICIITPGYPTPQQPTRYTFVDQLACAMADEGVEVTVISPNNLFRDKTFFTKRLERKTGNGNMVTVIQPPMLSFSSKTILGYPTGRLTERAFYRAVSRALGKLKGKIDVLYGHFLVPAGTTIAKLGKRYGLPSVCAFGESSLWSVESVGMEYAREKLAGLSGIISVSSENRRVLIDNSLATSEKIAVFPNGVNHELFFPRERQAVRRELRLPQDAVIAVYTGAFNHEKGALRAQEAALRIPVLKMLYIGGGPDEPCGDNILFKGRVSHENIPLYLSAADFFVLPTLAEGCCNAILEAMACGLPIISANGQYNDDILRDEYSIRVNPEDIDALVSAMKTLVSAPERIREMSACALQASMCFDVRKRAAKILQYLRDIL